MELCLSLSPAGEDEDDDEDDVSRLSSTQQQRFTPSPLLLHHFSLRPPFLRPNPYRLQQRLNRRSKPAPLGSQICEISDETSLSLICQSDILVSPVKAMANLDLNMQDQTPLTDDEYVFSCVCCARSLLSPPRRRCLVKLMVSLNQATPSMAPTPEPPNMRPWPDLVVVAQWSTMAPPEPPDPPDDRDSRLLHATIRCSFRSAIPHRHWLKNRDRFSMSNSPMVSPVNTTELVGLRVVGLAHYLEAKTHQNIMVSISALKIKPQTLLLIQQAEYIGDPSKYPPPASRTLPRNLVSNLDYALLNVVYEVCLKALVHGVVVTNPKPIVSRRLIKTVAISSDVNTLVVIVVVISTLDGHPRKEYKTKMVEPLVTRTEAIAALARKVDKSKRTSSVKSESFPLVRTFPLGSIVFKVHGLSHECISFNFLSIVSKMALYANVIESAP